MSAPYMQLYVADYLGDTRHLTTEQHGAYMLLLMTMWRSDGVLSDDPAKLARIAGLTVARWKKISDDIMAFFTPCEGGITQARLVAELTIAEEKSEKRSKAGKAGGRAKALKDKKLTVANAKRLPQHSPEPEPDKEIPPTPQGGSVDLKRFAKALSIAADAGCDFGLMVERVHKAQPVVEGKRRSTAPDVERALAGALRRGGLPSEIWAAVQAYYALPANTKDGGQFASGSAVVLNKDRWREFLTPASQAASTAPVQTFPGPPALRASVVAAKDEAFALAWIDPCGWRDDRTLLARNSFALNKLRAELGEWMVRHNVRAEIASETTQPKDRAA